MSAQNMTYAIFAKYKKWQMHKQCFLKQIIPKIKFRLLYIHYKNKNSVL